LSEWGEEGRLLAGGTDVMAQYNAGEIAPGALIHIGGIAPLSFISVNGRTTIGALSTHCNLAADAAFSARHPAVANAARLVGGWQTQAIGTVGGNLCNASPAADLAPPLLVADAHLTLASISGERRLPLDEFIIGRRATARRPDELLTLIDLDPLPPDGAEQYIKLGRRGAMDVAIVGVAVRLGLCGDGTIETARVAVCSVAATPRRVAEAEAALTGAPLAAGALAAAGQALVAAVDPIDDARGTASYRRRVLPGLLERAVLRCGEEIRR
jgi:carbon-monoxide dehydrogenase medium subunit